MAVITVISPEQQVQKITAPAGAGLLETLRSAGCSVPAICGGRGSCGKCGVRVLSGGLLPVAADEVRFSAAELAAGWRLACAAFPAGDITVQIPETGEGRFVAVDGFAPPETVSPRTGDLFVLHKSARSFARQLENGRELSFAELAEASQLAGPAPEGGFYVCRNRGRIMHVGGKSDPLYAVAVDLGTTTLAFALVDLRSGTVVCRRSAVNKQREFGGDVISRIQRANGGDLSLLSHCARNQIAGGIAALCAAEGVESRRLRTIAIAGNTPMLHLFLGLSCQTLGKAPFTPVSLDMVSASAREIFSDLAVPVPDCEVVVLPGISTYVGADIAAGLFFADLHHRAATVMFMDIGTNGEIALVHQGAIHCTATAAGPAFEGGNIRWGTGGVPGAISRVRFRDGVFETETIGNQPPAGICGSGVVDAAYQGLKHGHIEPSGRFSEKTREKEMVLAAAPDGRDIVFCQKDVRELQLGKSAIRSGLDALLNHAGLGYGDIQTLYIAGGFGFNLDIQSAAGIGLVPGELLPKVSLIGNSALGGAVKYLLNEDSGEALRRIIEQSAEFSLPEDPYFTEHFIENINF